MYKRLKHVGVDAFLAQRKGLLDEYDKAKQQITDDPVETDHGVVAEGLIKTWLCSFLPKKFGVAKGYIITTNLEYEGPLEEWDIIIYDALESPILFTRGTTNQGNERRAILGPSHLILPRNDIYCRSDPSSCVKRGKNAPGCLYCRTCHLLSRYR
jgi:hypothetical protein